MTVCTNHNSPSIGIDDLVIAATELSRRSSDGKRVAWVRLLRFKRHGKLAGQAQL